MSRGSKRFQEFVELAEELEIPAYRINYFFDVRWAASHKRWFGHLSFFLYIYFDTIGITQH